MKPVALTATAQRAVFLIKLRRCIKKMLVVVNIFLGAGVMSNPGKDIECTILLVIDFLFITGDSFLYSTISTMVVINQDQHSFLNP